MNVRASIECSSGGFAIVLGSAWRRDCGVGAGDVVDVVLAPEGPQRGDLADDVRAALDIEPAAGAFFNGLAQFYRRASSLVDATKRRPEERERRIAEMIDLLRPEEGTSLGSGRQSPDASRQPSASARLLRLGGSGSRAPRESRSCGMLSVVVQVLPAHLDWLEALAGWRRRVHGPVRHPGRGRLGGVPEALPLAVEGARERSEDEWGTHLFFDDVNGALVGSEGSRVNRGTAKSNWGTDRSFTSGPRHRHGRRRRARQRARSAGINTVTAHTLGEETRRRRCSARTDSSGPATSTIPVREPSGDGSCSSPRPAIGSTMTSGWV